jgi:hypothetical protein
MTCKEKIQRHRIAYISKYGTEPRSIILGYEIADEMQRLMPSRHISPGAQLYGMTVLLDNDKPTRVEVGDITV